MAKGIKAENGAKKMSKETYAAQSTAEQAAKSKGIKITGTKKMPSGRFVYVYEDTTPHYENGRKTGLAKIENGEADWKIGDKVKTPVGEGEIFMLPLPFVKVKLEKGGEWMGQWTKLQYMPPGFTNANNQVTVKKTGVLPNGYQVKAGQQFSVRAVDRFDVFLKSSLASFGLSRGEYEKYFAEPFPTTSTGINNSFQNSWHLQTSADIQKMAKAIGAPPPTPAIIKAVLKLIKDPRFFDDMAIKVVTGKVPPNHYENAVGDEYSQKLGYEAAKAGKAKVVPHNRAGREIWFQDWILGYEKYEKGGGNPVQNSKQFENGRKKAQDRIENGSDVHKKKNGKPFSSKSEAEKYRVAQGLDKTHTVAPVTEIHDDKYHSGYVVRPR